jgi:glycosyltransferase involved in cell wall biosynthesis
VTVIYGSDFSVVGYQDREFGETFAWDTDLLGGYASVFLSRVGDGKARSLAEVSWHGLGRALRQAAPQAVLLAGYSPRFHQAAFLTAWRAGHPLLFRGETTDHARQRSSPKRWLRDLALRWLYRRCARLLYVGERSLQHFRRLGCLEQKLVFSPYCVDPSPFQADEAARDPLRAGTRHELGIAEPDFVLLFSGKLSARKGPEVLLRAARLLPADLRERTVALFLGDGEMAAGLKRTAADHPPLRAYILGFRNQRQLSPYYHAADLLVLPSLSSETWGLVVNEALHHGLPCVVSTAVGCAPDLVQPGTTGEVCAPGSPDSLAAAFQRALVLVGRAEGRAACRGKVAAYSVEAAAHGIAQAYWSVVRQTEAVASR